MSDSLFVSGAFRSGTTLLEKALSNHRRILVASQPFPFLYFRAKLDFYEALGISRRYPLDHLFGEAAFSNQQFSDFLRDYRISDKSVRELAASQKDYFGWWTPELAPRIPEMSGGSLFDIWNMQNRLLERLVNLREGAVLGSKEILCEEFMPYLSGHDVAGLLSIRDPRDLVTSLNFGRGISYTGEIRPTLFVIRVWRKSVAFALQMWHQPKFIVSRFEDFLADPIQTLSDIASLWGLDPFDESLFVNGIQDQFGRPWKGNSSFSVSDTFNTEAIGGYRKLLPDNVRKYVEACCWPEMQVLGYEFDADSRREYKHIISDYSESFDISRPDFPSTYSSDQVNVEMEIARIELLMDGGVSDEDASQWFLFEKAYEALGKGMSLR